MPQHLKIGTCFLDDPKLKPVSYDSILENGVLIYGQNKIMAIDFSQVRLLKDAEFKPGEKIIYSMDCNVSNSSDEEDSYPRINSELADIECLIQKGAKVIILGHRGRHKEFKDHPEKASLEFAEKYLSRKLGTKRIDYFPENTGQEAIDFTDSIDNGSIAIMGNTRTHLEEEDELDENRQKLAQEFSRLGNVVAVGGFGKAHRANASNVEILQYLKGYLTESQVNEMKKLEPWAGRAKPRCCAAVLGKAGSQIIPFSVVAIGGIKGEKIQDGLAGFVNTYDYIIVGGMPLNTILKVRGYEVGNSKLKDGNKTFEKDIEKILANEEYAKKIYIPQKVIIARKDGDNFVDSKPINIEEKVPQGYMIVDFEIDKQACSMFEKAVIQRGRIVMAGTPCWVEKGFTEATRKIATYMNRNPQNSIALGEDTVSDMKLAGLEFKAQSSTGGGSALYFLAYGTTPVFEALKKNKEKFNYSK